MMDDSLIDRASRGDLDAAADLDARGLLVGAGESPEEYGGRLRALKANTLAMREALALDGRYEVEGFVVAADEEIPPALFEEAGAVTHRLYRFEIDWVPGFFINPSFSLLFGGCAFYFYPDFFALFIIRKCFATRRRWLIYSRTELLAHELCHVARLGLMSSVFEETFAYQTATSRFRRMMGSIFRAPSDSFLFLGSTLLLLIAQVARTLFVPALWIAPFWLTVAGVFAFLMARHIRYRRLYARAGANLAALGAADAGAVLFRCTDAEVFAVSRLSGRQDLEAWLDEQALTSFRWQVVRRRFPGLGGGRAPES